MWPEAVRGVCEQSLKLCGQSLVHRKRASILQSSSAVDFPSFVQFLLVRSSFSLAQSVRPFRAVKQSTSCRPFPTRRTSLKDVKHGFSLFCNSQSPCVSFPTAPYGLSHFWHYGFRSAFMHIAQKSGLQRPLLRTL